jgi:hypothetical protein
LEKLADFLVTPEHPKPAGGKLGLISDVPKTTKALEFLCG